MARPSLQQIYDLLLDEYGRKIADAFLAAAADIAERVEVGKIIDALAAGNIQAAIDALHLDPAVYNDLITTINQAYMAGGHAGAAAMPRTDGNGVVLAIRFDGRNLRVEQWLRDHSSQLVTRLTEDQRQAARQAMQEGMQRGDNPRTTALEIVGRIDRATGKRTGGILGLTAPQQTYVSNARAELATTDPASLNNYLDRQRRDKRYDPAVRKALKTGKPIPAEKAREMVQSYSNRLLKLRGDMIARTETLGALNQAQYEGLLQAVESGKISEGAIKRVWKSAHDPRVRRTHAVMDGDTVGLREAFVSPSGARLLFPGDHSLGAGAEETIHCRCIVQPRIDFFANFR